MRNRIVTLLLGAASIARPAQAQVSPSSGVDWRDSSARTIVARYPGNASTVLAILRQVDRPQQQGRLDSIAFGLVHLALVDSLGSELFLAMVVRDLFAAGDAWDTTFGGKPYSWAAERLVQIYRAATGSNHSPVSEARLVDMTRKEYSFPLLLTVATSTDARAASRAMEAMISVTDTFYSKAWRASEEERAGTASGLRALWDRVRDEPEVPAASNGNGSGPLARKGLPTPNAFEQLRQMAGRNGWRMAPSRPGAQPINWRDSSAASIAGRLRGWSGILPAVLRQATMLELVPKLGEIADALTAIAIESEEGSDVFILAEAGRQIPAFSTGISLPGMLERLIRIDQGVPPNRIVRRSTLRYMLEMPEHPKALGYLIEVATTNTPAAAWAMSSLLEEIDPSTILNRRTLMGNIDETTRALHLLWDKYSTEPLPPISPRTMIPDIGFPSQVIPNREVASALESLAQRNGWGGGRRP